MDVNKKYLDDYGRRFTKKEKRLFQAELKNDFEALGYTCEVEAKRGRFSKVENIYIGNPKQAKYIYVVPYNTPPKILFSKNKIYPQDGFYNMKKMFLPTYMPMFIGYAVLIAFAYLIPSLLNETLLMWLYPVSLIYLGFFVWFVLKGFGNKKNYIDNSISIALAYELASNASLVKRKEMMFIFTDGNKPTTSLGNAHALTYLAKFNKQKLPMIGLYCIGEGDIIQMMCDKETKKNAKDLSKGFVSDYKIKTIHVGGEGKNNTIIESFPKAMLISTGNVVDDKLCVKGIATSKDNRYNKNLVASVYAMLEQYTKQKR